MPTSQIRSQIVVAIGDLSVPASTVQVISGALAITNFSNNPVSNNLVQVAGAPIGIQGNASDAITATSSALLPTACYPFVWNGTTWDRAATMVQAIPGTGILAVGIYGLNIGANTPKVLTGDAPADADSSTRNRLYTWSMGGLFNGSTIDRARSALGTVGIAAVNTEGTRTTYSAAVAQAAFSAASGTDVFLLNGSITNVSRIVRAEVSFTSLNPVNIPMRWIKRSAVTTAGTSSLPAMVVHDTSGAAATAVAVNYTNTAGQAPGAPIGIVRSAVVTATLASQGVTSPWVVDFSGHNEQSPLLRGTEVWALTLASGAQTTGASNISVNVTWTEALA